MGGVKKNNHVSPHRGDDDDDDDHATINVEGVSFPLKLLSPTKALLQPALTVKLRCPHNMNQQTCIRSANCLKIHGVLLKVYDRNMCKEMSSTRFLPTVGLVRYCAEAAQTEGKAAMRCRDDPGCPWGAKCHFLHQFESVPAEKATGKKELELLLKRNEKRANSNTDDDDVLPIPPPMVSTPVAHRDDEAHQQKPSDARTAAERLKPTAALTRKEDEPRHDRHVNDEAAAPSPFSVAWKKPSSGDTAARAVFKISTTSAPPLPPSDAPPLPLSDAPPLPPAVRLLRILEIITMDAADQFENGQASSETPLSIARMLAEAVRCLGKTPAYEAAYTEAQAIFMSVMGQALDFCLVYRTGAPEKKHPQQQHLVDFADTLITCLVDCEVITSFSVSFILSRVVTSKRPGDALLLSNLADVIHLVLTLPASSQRLRNVLDSITILELINTTVARGLPSQFSDSARSEVAKHINKDIYEVAEAHDAQMKRYVASILRPLLLFGTDPSAQHMINAALRQVSLRVQTVVGRLLKDPTFVSPSLSSYHTFLYMVEQETCAVVMSNWNLRHCPLVDQSDQKKSNVASTTGDAIVYPIECPGRAKGGAGGIWLAVEIDPLRKLAFVQWLPALFVGQFVRITSEEEKVTEREGTRAHTLHRTSARFVIKRVTSYTLFLSIHPDEAASPPWWVTGKTKLMIAVEHNRWHLDLLARSTRHPVSINLLQWIASSTPAHPFRPVELSSSSLLDETQKCFIRSVLSRPRVSVVVGPPGTGKTHSIVAAIEIVVRSGLGRVLALASNNYAVNVLARLLKAARLDVFRIFTKSTSPIDVQTGHFSSLLRYSNGVRCPRTDTLLRPDEAYSIDSEFVNATPADLRGHAIICTTTAHTEWMQRAQIDFDFIFVDEASQSTLSEPLIPLAFNPRATLVLAGDPLQLGPPILSDIAHEHGLQKSLVHHIVDHAHNNNGRSDPAHLTTLRHSYRNHREILALFNGLFYKGLLLAALQVPRVVPCSFLADPAVPLVFVDVSTENPILRAFHSPTENMAHSTPSVDRFDSEVEAQAVVDAVLSLIRSNGVSFAMHIGIIAAYGQQVLNISAKLRQRLGDAAEAILVGTVDQYQGQERSVIIISLVHSTTSGREGILPFSTLSLGFIGNSPKTNVAISRAEALLVFVGDHAALRRLPATEPWRIIAEQTHKRRLVVTAAEVADPNFQAAARVNISGSGHLTASASEGQSSSIW